ncbi:MAG TPA: M48 family metalloprotease, partial [Kamptonema sp.]|nr:M48 family metalloprotease [Kamptonema sp.]
MVKGLGYLGKDAIKETFMASPTNPDVPDSSTENSLAAGLAALKAKDYPGAIAHLEAIAKTEQNQPLGVRAQMGLVLAYKKTGKLKSAIALCSTLTKNSNIQVKAWASKTLKDLVKRIPPQLAEKQEKEGNTGEENSTVETGFIPFQPPTEASQTTPTENLTGFVPFDAIAAPTIPAKSIKQKSISPPLIPQLPDPISEQEDTETPLVTPLESNIDTDSNLLTSPQLPEPETLATTPEISDNTEAVPYQISWRRSDRAQRWRPLKPLKLGRFWFEQIATAIALFWVTVAVVKFLLTTTNAILLHLYLLLKLPFLQPISLFYLDPTPFLQFTFGLLFVCSPWLIDKLNQHFYGMQPLPMTTLFNHSQEANRVLRSFCRKRDLPVPAIKVLPTNAPIAMSYGCLPRFARIVVSQGLLEQLSEDEIAAVFARELGHIVHWDFAVMSLAITVVQIPYNIYWQAAYWGERTKDLPNMRLPISVPGFLISFLRGVAIAISSASYGIFWLLRWPVLWLSRRRVYYSDRKAAEITGNPNGLTRAIAKMAIGIAEDVRQQQQIGSLLESFEFLTPIGVKQAITLGSAASIAPLETLLQWDIHNPYRKWLEINNTHPLIGERLQLLTLYAQHWKLETELELANKPAGETGRRGDAKTRETQNSKLKTQNSKLL